MMDKLRAREAIHNIMYLLDQDLNWYKRRLRSKGRENSFHVGRVMAVFISTRVRMLAPFAPFLTEEIWEKMIIWILIPCIHLLFNLQDGLTRSR